MTGTQRCKSISKWLDFTTSSLHYFEEKRIYNYYYNIYNNIVIITTQHVRRSRFLSFRRFRSLENFNPAVKGKLNTPTYLLVIEVVYEGGEAAGLVLQRQRQLGDVADKHRVKDPSHLQVVAGAQRLETGRTDMNTQGTEFRYSRPTSAAD